MLALIYKGITTHIYKGSVIVLIVILMIIFSVHTKCANYYFYGRWRVIKRPFRRQNTKAVGLSIECLNYCTLGNHGIYCYEEECK